MAYRRRRVPRLLSIYTKGKRRNLTKITRGVALAKSMATIGANHESTRKSAITSIGTVVVAHKSAQLKAVMPSQADNTNSIKMLTQLCSSSARCRTGIKQRIQAKVRQTMLPMEASLRPKIIILRSRRSRSRRTTMAMLFEHDEAIEASF